MAQITIRQGQNLFDIALGQYGSVGGVYDILNRNPQLFSPTQKVFPGDVFEVADIPINLNTKRVLETRVVATDEGLVFSSLQRCGD